MDEQPLQQQPQQAAMAMLMDMDDDVTDPSDWPTASGAQLDQLMRCTICRDFFGAPVMFVGCSHTCTYQGWASDRPTDRLTPVWQFAPCASGGPSSTSAYVLNVARYGPVVPWRLLKPTHPLAL